VRGQPQRLPPGGPGRQVQGRLTRRAAVLSLALATVAGCGGGDSTSGPAPSAPAALRLTSPAFEAGATIPEKFTCSGDEVSPPLRWAAVPSGTRELVLLVEDPDAPGGTFVHWTVAAIAPETRSFPEGSAPAGAIEAAPWRGPCPPEGDDPHRYRFLLYALGKRSTIEAGASPDDVHTAVDRARPLARGVLVGRFGR
jgi:Raf kinase inhibitor-like YbhB/YbcL family protein